MRHVLPAHQLRRGSGWHRLRRFLAEEARPLDAFSRSGLRTVAAPYWRRHANFAYGNTASTMLTAELVGTIRVSLKPPLPRSEPYSASVRSRPPDSRSI